MARRSSLFSPMALLRRGALYKGLLGGRRGWMAVGAVLWTPKLLKRLFGRNEEIISTEKLKHGQLMQLEPFRNPTRRQRRKASRRAGSSATEA